MEGGNRNAGESEPEEEMQVVEQENTVQRSNSGDGSSSENELYCFYDSDGADTYTHAYDSYSSHLGSDLGDDDDDEEDGSYLDNRAWGMHNEQFYETDFMEDDLDETSDLDPTDLEEAEARRIQRRIASELNETDFVIALRASERQTTENEKLEEVSRDVSSLSTRQKLDLMQKESPEFFVLVQDLKTKLNEIDNVLIPILNYFGNTNNMPAPVKFLKKKFLVLTNYCTNITFYLLLKAKRSPVENHPVLKSLYKYRRVMEEIQELDEAMRPKIEKVLMELKDNKNPALEKLASALRKKNILKLIKKSKEDMMRKEAHANAVGPIAGPSAEPMAGPSAEPIAGPSAEPIAGPSAEPMAGPSGEPTAGPSAGPYVRPYAGPYVRASGIYLKQGFESVKILEKSVKPDKGKRAITYQMAKNKGLIPRRNKLQRNPRVKHRKKYRKALIKRRGQMRFPRTEIPAYGGEPSGIKSNVTKSIKFK